MVIMDSHFDYVRVLFHTVYTLPVPPGNGIDTHDKIL